MTMQNKHDLRAKAIHTPNRPERLSAGVYEITQLIAH
jgi:hypothetical protein